MDISKSFVKFCDKWGLSTPKIEGLMLRNMKPGKILRRELLVNNPITFKDVNTRTHLDYLVQKGLHALSAKKYAEEVKLAKDYSTIKMVYDDPNCPSCMMGGERAKIAAQFYAANNFAVAYRHDGKNVTARAVIYGKQMLEAYGPEAMKLNAALTELDYDMVEGSLLPFWVSFEVPFINDKYYIPYLDCASGCFIPYANRHDVQDQTVTCLYIPYSLEYKKFINEDMNAEFSTLREYIERGDYVDRLLAGMPHGEACGFEGALHHLDQILKPLDQ